MRTIEEIRDLKEYCEKDLYAGVREQQDKDLQYINDTFKTGIKAPHRVFRSGIGRKIADAPADAIITSNPLAKVEIFRGRLDAGIRLSEVINQQWLETLKRQNPNPVKEFVKSALGMGEAYYKLLHNERWARCPLCNGTGKKGGSKCKYCGGEGDVEASKRIGLPIKLIVPNSMIIYGSPEEDDNGIPNWVIVYYERQLKDLIPLYPYLDKIDKRKKRIKWLEYVDSEIKYCEADGEPITDGIEDNLYGRTPFVRRYSGFGRRSSDGELSNLIVSDIRFQRDLIKEECTTRSNINSIENMFAHRGKTVTSPGKINKKAFSEAAWGEYALKMFEFVPEGTKIENDDVPNVPAEMYGHLATVRMELSQRNPLIDIPGGTSGRHEEKILEHGLSRHATVVENTQNATATALEFGLKNICNTIPDWKPVKLNKGDLDADFQIRVDLKASDPIEEDRLITLGDRLRRLPNPAIDLETFHTEFLGYTEDRSKKVMAKMLADMVTIYNPDWAEVAGMVAAEESGMDLYLEKLAQRKQMMQQGLAQPPAPTTQQRAQGEVQTETGREMGTRGGIGARESPDRYTRRM